MQASTGLGRRLGRNVPNAISIARLCATVVLLVAVVRHRIGVFQWLLLACLLSDILDGLIARAFHLESRVGAFLDSTADVLTMAMGTLGLLAFQRPFVSAHARELLLVLAFYFAEVLA